MSAAFAVLLGGTSALTPLLPRLSERLSMDPLFVSMLFVGYIIPLATLLLLLSRVQVARWAPLMLVSSMGITAIADVLIAMVSPSGLMLGRFLYGIAGGAATGSASMLVVAAIGSRGRAVTATGSIIGAFVGVVSAQLLSAFAPWPPIELTFLGHAAISLLAGAGLLVILGLRRAANRGALAGGPARSKIRSADTQYNLAALASGSIAWIALSGAYAYFPSAFGDLGMDVSKDFGVALMLVASVTAQFLEPALQRIAPWVSGTALVPSGIALLLAGGITRSEVAAISGIILTGFGVGIAYRLGLVAFTQGAAKGRQGAFVSFYTGVSYVVSAGLLFVGGLVGRLLSLVPATALFYGVVAVAALCCYFVAPRIRDTQDDAEPLVEA
ncbi:MFS transporter [Arthrobacter sp. NPDC056727]|uniref:MFS transporter n=1 Tax=Arthrobacter sp. NPDC056727 TaxID=3345927 RepID=UPI003671FA33